MTAIDTLRPSRDGDQFHYLWAARQSLRLLEPGTRLVALYVESVSEHDTAVGDGDEVIDLAEYWGSTDLADADKVVYRQLKHSTRNADDPWTISWLAKTLIGFARKFARVLAEQPDAVGRVSFELVSNRPAADSVHRALEDIGAQRLPGRDPGVVAYISDRLRGVLTTEQIAALCRRLRIDDGAPHLLRLRHLFDQDLTALLPGAPADDHVLLKEMVASRASSIAGDTPYIRRETVLAALKTSEDQLLPAPNLIARPATVIITEQVGKVGRDLVQLVGRPMIIHAAGGLGKSVLTSEIGPMMPSGSVTLVYDCFGNGTYRRPSMPRHEHRQGLVQLINELAGRGLCHPVIPSASATDGDYSRAFVRRVAAAAEALAAQDCGALLVLVVDAADNAALIAGDTDARSFVAGVLRERFPDNVRLVMLCRTERMNLLNPPPGCEKVRLEGFGIRESTQHLEATFGTVSPADAAEFHRRTGGNPRVQALVLESASGISDALGSLGEATDRDGSLLDELLHKRLADVRDAHRRAADEIEQLCTALAALRPMIPVRVLAELVSVPEALVHSFVADLGRPLLIDGDAVQFRDEPTETWFRDNFRPTGAALDAFLGRLIPLASADPYVATSLPSLLWEADRVDDLVALALSDDALPQAASSRRAQADPQRREIAQQRAQFALKAALRRGRDFDAGRLALRAGALAAGRTRRLELFRANTDLAGAFLDPSIVEHLVATRGLLGSWPGSNLPSEAALLSGAAGQSDYARNRLRSAAGWMSAWTRQAVERDERSGVDDNDVAEVGWGILNTDGASECIRFLSRWSPRTVGFDAGLIIVRRLADLGRADDLQRLAWHGARLKHVQLAVAQACFEANVSLTERAARRIVGMLKRHRRRIPMTSRVYHSEPDGLGAISWAVAAGLRHQLINPAEAARILGLYLPDTLGHDAGSRYERRTATLMLGFALLAKTRGQRLDTDAIAGTDVVNAKKRERYESSTELREYRANVEPLAPWMDLWVDLLTESDTALLDRYQELATATFTDRSSYEPPHLLLNTAARVGTRLLAARSTPAARDQLASWCQRNNRHLTRAALTDIVRISSPAPDLHPLAVAAANLVRTDIDKGREDAKSMSDALIRLARATYRFDEREARAHFLHAVEITDRIGDDAYARWEALCAIAGPAGKAIDNRAARAYRLAQVAENLEPFLGEGPDSQLALEAVGRLSGPDAIAIGSRWRDRRTAQPAAVASALATGPASVLATRPAAALSLIPLSDYAPTLTLLEHVLRQDPDCGATLARVVAEFERPIRHSAAAYESLDTTAAEIGVDLTNTLYAPTARAVAQPLRQPYSSRRWFLPAADTTDDADRELSRSRQALAQVDFTSVAGWDEALALVENRDSPLRHDEVLAQAVAVQPTKLAPMLSATRASVNLSLWDYDKIISLLADLPQLPQAVRSELREVARTITSRFCRELTATRYDRIDLAMLSQLAGEPCADYLGDALRSLGHSPEPLSADESFALAGRLADRVSPDEAAALFDDCAALFLEVAPLDSSDGAFHTLPPVPDSLSHCLAGLLWTALGDASARTRWRAAHAVRLLLATGSDEEVAALLDLAEGRSPVDAFVDARLVFYDKHALQWLLFALARAAHDTNSQDAVARFEGLLRSVLFDRAPHAVMQHSARQALLTLHQAGSIVVNDDDLAAVQHAGTPVSIRETDLWRQRSRRLHSLDHLGATEETPADAEAPADRADHGADATETRFHFFMDFREYWCRDLGEAFGIDDASIERLADEVLIDRWKTSFRGKYTEDARHALELYPQGTHVYKSDWPIEDNLDFYLCTHALYEVAGHLLAHLPVVKSPDADIDQYQDFLYRHVPTRDDGRWLADRRDAVPSGETIDDDHASGTPGSLQREEQQGDEWTCHVTKADFEARLFPAPGWVALWEYATARTYTHSQTIWVHSALVSPGSGRAHLAALQTPPSARAFRIPAARDLDYQSVTVGYELTGWIDDLELPEGCDSKDPHARRVRYPPPRPTEPLAEQVGLVPDADMRVWRRDGSEAMRSLVWDATEADSQREPGTSGHRLEAVADQLTEILNLIGRSLIVEVMLDRAVERPRYASREDYDDAETPYVEPPAHYYLFDATGGCFQL